MIPVDDVLSGIRIIDADAHMTEPPDLWTSRVPASIREQLPQQRTIDGATAWYIGDSIWTSTGGNVIKRGGEKVRGQHIIQPFDDVDPAAWETKARLDLLDREGIFAQILYPNAVGFTSNHIFAIEDLPLRGLVLQTYNDFFVDTQVESEGRLFPQALLPIWDMDLTIAEMTRLHDAGIAGYTITDKPELLGLPELPDAYFAPMWRFADETQSVMNFHIGSGSRRGTPRPDQLKNSSTATDHYADLYWKEYGPQRRMAIVMSQSYMSNVRVITNLCMGGFFDNYPNLQIVSAESGMGWVPFILESMEYSLDEGVTDPHERSMQLRRPTEYFRDHISVTCWFERIGPRKLIDEIGVKNIMVETDIPHPTCLYPNAREYLAKTFVDTDLETRRRLLQDNAAELYKISLPA